MIFGFGQPKEINDIFSRQIGNKIEKATHYTDDTNYLIKLIDEQQKKIDTLEAHKDISKENLIAFIDELNKLRIKYNITYPIPCAGDCGNDNQK
jgi:hypothetical protein